MTCTHCHCAIFHGYECKDCRVARICDEQESRNKRHRREKESVTVSPAEAHRLFSNFSLFCDAT